MKSTSVYLSAALWILFGFNSMATASDISTQDVDNYVKKWLSDCPENREGMVFLDTTLIPIEIKSNDSVVAYVYNFSPIGWAVVGIGDDCLLVLSFSFSSMLPNNFDHPVYRRAMAWDRGKSTAGKQVVQSTWANKDIVVGPLLTSHWHQNDPYNEQCPTIQGEPTRAGCAAIAGAQILYYYKQPVYGSGTHAYAWFYSFPFYSILSADFSNPYIWWMMLDSVSSGSSPERRAAVAELVYEFGNGLQMDYGIATSGSLFDLVPNVFSRYFRFQDNLAVRNRRDYTDDVWFDILSHEIDMGRPVYYSFDPVGGEPVDERHASVCDGYMIASGQKYVHFNYGWDDTNTDYYEIDNIGEKMEDDRIIIYLVPNGWESVENSDLKACSARCAGWGDYNGDRYPDLFVGDDYYSPGRIFKNDSAGGIMLDAFPNSELNYVDACGWADFNRDGYDDLLICGDKTELLFGGANGLVASSAQFDFEPNLCRSCAIGDINNDGYLDLALGTWEDGVLLYLGEGSGDLFVQISSPISSGNVTSVSLVDYSGDRVLDLGCTPSLGGSDMHFYIGNGMGGFQVDINSATGGWANGHSWGDIDNDGDLDLFICGMGLGNRLYRNTGSDFEDITTPNVRLYVETLTSNVNFEDVDLDSDLDMYMVNSPLMGDYSPNLLFLNDGLGGFIEDKLFGGGLPQQGASTVSAFADFDLDGDVDLYTDGYWSPPMYSRLLVNNFDVQGNSLGLNIFGSISNKSGIGAKLKVSYPGGDIWRYVVGTANGTCNNFGNRTCLGVPEHQFLGISVEWPSGQFSWRPAGFIPGNLDIVEIGVSEVEFQPSELVSVVAFPNPFNSSIEIGISGKSGAQWVVSVYNLRGACIREYCGNIVEGKGKIFWDGMDSNGSPVSSGKYFICVSNEEYDTIREVTLVR